MPIDCHMHTPLCGHASGMPVEYVEAAARAGLQLITFTCHLPMDRVDMGGPGIRMSTKMLPVYLDLVEQGRKLGERLGVEVLCGIEGEWHPDPEILAEIDQSLALHPWDFVLGSLHAALVAYERRFEQLGCRNDHDRIELYFRDLADGVRSKRYDSMSHPDVVRLYGVVDRYEPSEHEATIRAFLQACVESRTCIEVNTSGLIKAVPCLHPHPLILKWASEMGVKLTLGSDSHRPDQVGQFFNEVIPQLRAAGFSSVNYFRNRVRSAVVLPYEVAGA
jgi:histidinol-phosphatase (PHP family)